MEVPKIPNVRVLERFLLLEESAQLIHSTIRPFRKGLPELVGRLLDPLYHFLAQLIQQTGAVPQSVEVLVRLYQPFHGSVVDNRYALLGSFFPAFELLEYKFTNEGHSRLGLLAFLCLGIQFAQHGAVLLDLNQ